MAMPQQFLSSRRALRCGSTPAKPSIIFAVGKLPCSVSTGQPTWKQGLHSMRLFGMLVLMPPRVRAAGLRAQGRAQQVAVPRPTVSSLAPAKECCCRQRRCPCPSCRPGRTARRLLSAGCHGRAACRQTGLTAAPARCLVVTAACTQLAKCGGMPRSGREMADGAGRSRVHSSTKQGTPKPRL